MAKRGKDRSQRVKDMIDQFMIYHNMGYGIPEIAKKFEITTTTVYSHLQEIAEKNGFYDRKELLERIHPKHNISKHSRKAHTCNFDDALDYASKISSRIKEVITEVEKIIKEDSSC